MRLLRADLRKLRARPATWVTFGLLVGLHGLVTFMVVLGSRIAGDAQAVLAARQFLTFPAAYELVLSMVLSIGGLLVVAYGAAIAGAEWTWGTLKAAVVRGEGRATYVLALFGALAVFTSLGVLVAFAAGVAVTAAGAGLTGVSLSGMGEPDALLRLPEQLARAFLATAMNAGLGFAVATIARSQLAGIATGVGLFFAEGIAGFFAPHVVKWLPFSASGAVIGGSGGSVVVNGAEIGATLDSGTAIVVTIGWLAAFLAAALVRTERAEIGG